MSIQDIQVPTFSTQYHNGHYCYFLFLSTSPQCPVYDLDNNVAFTGMYQTMTKKGAITVQVLFEVFYMAVSLNSRKVKCVHVLFTQTAL